MLVHGIGMVLQFALASQRRDRTVSIRAFPKRRNAYHIVSKLLHGVRTLIMWLVWLVWLMPGAMAMTRAPVTSRHGHPKLWL